MPPAIPTDFEDVRLVGQHDPILTSVVKNDAVVVKNDDVDDENNKGRISPRSVVVAMQPSSSSSPPKKKKKQVVLQQSSSDGTGRTTTTMTRAEVLADANVSNRLLLIIHDGVYDLTEWQYSHPGGILTMRALCGKDATDCFYSMHPQPIRKSLLDRFHCANLVDDNDNGEKDKDDDEVTTIEAFRKLTTEMKQSGFFNTNYNYYYKKAIGLILLFGLVLACVLGSNDIRIHALAGILLGLFWQQTAFIGHDLGHNGITQNRQNDTRLGLFVGNFCTGVGIGWWKRGHNIHHICTNSLHWDPDIQHLPVFAINTRFLTETVFSEWYGWELDLNPLAHVFVKYQHYLYYPIMAFARFNLYAQSLLHACGYGPYGNPKVDKVENRIYHIGTLIGFWGWLLLLVWQLPTIQSIVCFVLLSHNIAGILHVQITLSHFAMDTYGGVTYDDNENGFLPTQLEGTMDIDCSPYMDWFHGGLQFQTVHHLWPGLPRQNLRRAQRILEVFCDRYGIRYHRASFWDANCLVFHKLRETGQTTKTFSELFEEGWNLNG